MKIFDEDGNVLDNPDLSIGKLILSRTLCWHNWIVDEPEISGIKAEVGHWITVDENGNELDFEGSYVEDWKSESPVMDSYEFQMYILYTDEELEQIAHQEVIDSLPDAIAELSTIASDHVEYSVDLETALAELSEIVSGLVMGGDQNGEVLV